jgi:hypothetical protein
VSWPCPCEIFVRAYLADCLIGATSSCARRNRPVSGIKRLPSSLPSYFSCTNSVEQVSSLFRKNIRYPKQPSVIQAGGRRVNACHVKSTRANSIVNTTAIISALELGLPRTESNVSLKHFTFSKNCSTTFRHTFKSFHNRICSKS